MKNQTNRASAQLLTPLPLIKAGFSGCSATLLDEGKVPTKDAGLVQGSGKKQLEKQGKPFWTGACLPP